MSLGHSMCVTERERAYVLFNCSHSNSLLQSSLRQQNSAVFGEWYECVCKKFQELKQNKRLISEIPLYVTFCRESFFFIPLNKQNDSTLMGIPKASWNHNRSSAHSLFHLNHNVIMSNCL